VVDASTDYGFAGTLDGLLYKWELVSGRKAASMDCSKSKLHIDLWSIPLPSYSSINLQIM
jgi:hypothetical protein